MLRIRKQQIVAMGSLLGLLLVYQQCAPVSFQGVEAGGLSGKGFGFSEEGAVSPGSESVLPVVVDESKQIVMEPENGDDSKQVVSEPSNGNGSKQGEPRPNESLPVVENPDSPSQERQSKEGQQAGACKEVSDAEIEKVEGGGQIVSCASDENADCAVICHIPGGNPQKMKTLMVGVNARLSHIARHGDVDGPCGGSIPERQKVCEEQE